MFEVQNQPPPLEPYNLFAERCGTVARRCAARGASWAKGELTALGATLGKPETVQLGFDANKFTPQLRTLDRYGHRLDEVEFHPAWHRIARQSHSKPVCIRVLGRIRSPARMSRARPATSCSGRSKAASIARSR